MISATDFIYCICYNIKYKISINRKVYKKNNTFELNIAVIVHWFVFRGINRIFMITGDAWESVRTDVRTECVRDPISAFARQDTSRTAQISWATNAFLVPKQIEQTSVSLPSLHSICTFKIIYHIKSIMYKLCL